MTSDSDGLMPTGMEENENNTTQNFNDNSQITYEMEQQKEQDIIEIEVPDAIKEHQAHPEFRPDWDTSEQDRDAFDSKLQKDLEKYSQHNKDISSSDQSLDEGKNALSKADIEKEWSTQLGNSKERDRS